MRVDAIAVLPVQDGLPGVTVRLQSRPGRLLELVEDGLELGVGRPVLRPHAITSDVYLCSKPSESANVATWSGLPRTTSMHRRTRPAESRSPTR